VRTAAFVRPSTVSIVTTVAPFCVVKWECVRSRDSRESLGVASLLHVWWGGLWRAGVWATVRGVIVGLVPRILRARRWLVGAAAVVAMGLAAAPASARDPVIAYLNASRQLQLYDSQAGAAVSAPALTVKNTQNAFAVSFDGRYIAYIAASDGDIHLFDRVAQRRDTASGDQHLHLA